VEPPGSSLPRHLAKNGPCSPDRGWDEVPWHRPLAWGTTRPCDEGIAHDVTILLVDCAVASLLSPKADRGNSGSWLRVVLQGQEGGSSYDKVAVWGMDIGGLSPSASDGWVCFTCPRIVSGWGAGVLWVGVLEPVSTMEGSAK